MYLFGRRKLKMFVNCYDTTYGHIQKAVGLAVVYQTKPYL
jgi:hypothetical protein